MKLSTIKSIQRKITLIGILLFISSMSFAKSLQALEVEIFSSDAAALPRLEKNVMRELQLDPYSAYGHYLMSHIYLREALAEGSSSEAIETALRLAQQTVHLDSTTDFGHVAMCDAYQALGFPEKALASLRHAPAESWRKIYRIIKFGLEPMSPQQKIEVLTKTTAQNPESLEIMLPLFIRLIKSLPEEERLEKLQDLHRRFPHPMLHQEIAQQYLNGKNPETGIQILKEIVQNHGIDSYPEIAINYGISLYYLLHNSKDAMTLFSELSHKKDLSAPYVSIIQMHMALIFLDRGDKANFLKSMLKSIALSPQQVATLDFFIAGIFERKHAGDFEVYMAAVNDMFPGRDDFYAQIGTVYADGLDQYDKAISYFEKALLLKPMTSSYHNRIGLSYYRTRRYYLALVSFDNAISLDPKDSIALYNRACIFSLTEMDKLAIHSLKLAIELNPSLQKHAENDEDFAKLRGYPSFQQIMQKSTYNPILQTSTPSVANGLVHRVDEAPKH